MTDLLLKTFLGGQETFLNSIYTGSKNSRIQNNRAGYEDGNWMAAVNTGRPQANTLIHICLAFLLMFEF